MGLVAISVMFHGPDHEALSPSRNKSLTPIASLSNHNSSAAPGVTVLSCELGD